MKLIVLVLARGGSKRLKKKNILKLNKKPLLTWTLKFAKKLPYITNILVSTDDKKIARIAKLNKAYVPWLRPKFLSGDDVASSKAAVHAIKWYEKNVEKIDGILLLQPTSPFRNFKTIKKIISLFKKNYQKNYVSVSESKFRNINFSKKNKVMIPYSNKKNKFLKYYKPNGSFYLISPQQLIKYKTFITKRAIGVLIKNEKEQIDINYKSDFKYAKQFI